MVVITIVRGGYKPTYNVWGPHIAGTMNEIGSSALKVRCFFPIFWNTVESWKIEWLQ